MVDAVVGRGLSTTGQAARDPRMSRWLVGPHTSLVYGSSVLERIRTGAWIDGELAKGRKVFYRYVSAEDHDGLVSLVGQDVLDTGRVEAIDVSDCLVQTGGDLAALRDWHHDLLARALGKGAFGMAIVSDDAALR